MNQDFLKEHPEMGRGVVIESHDDILTIAFNRTGIKKVAKNFVKFYSVIDFFSTIKDNFKDKKFCIYCYSVKNQWTYSVFRYYHFRSFY